MTLLLVNIVGLVFSRSIESNILWNIEGLCPTFQIFLSAYHTYNTHFLTKKLWVHNYIFQNFKY